MKKKEIFTEEEQKKVNTLLEEAIKIEEKNNEQLYIEMNIKIKNYISNKIEESSSNEEL